MGRAAVLLAVLLGGCGSSSLRGAGEECVSSSQCESGLVCNFGVDPHVCAGMGQPLPPDAVEPVFDAPPEIDADPFAPDAPPGEPDAPAGDPDANPTPDARLPDAGVPDARIDAMM